MNKVFNSLAHFYSYILSKARSIDAAAQADLTKVEQDLGTPLANGIAKVFGTKGTQTQSNIEVLAGAALSAAIAVGAVVAGGFVSIPADAAFAAAANSLMKDVKTVIGGGVLVVPVSPSAPASV